MDLRFSSADEAFRKEVAQWLADNLVGKLAVVRGREHVAAEGHRSTMRSRLRRRASPTGRWLTRRSTCVAIGDGSEQAILLRAAGAAC